MSISNYLFSGYKLKKAKKLALAARSENGEAADKLFQQAYTYFASYSNHRARYPDALHAWGLALLNHSHQKQGQEAVKLLEQASTKFTLCDAVKTNHLGALLDGGVAYMNLAKARGLALSDELYVKAKASFASAETIQQGSAAYNLACLSALQNNVSACLAALEEARDCGLIPDKRAILSDSDLDSVKSLSWFGSFIASLDDQEKPSTASVASQTSE